MYELRLTRNYVQFGLSIQLYNKGSHWLVLLRDIPLEESKREERNAYSLRDHNYFDRIEKICDDWEMAEDFYFDYCDLFLRVRNIQKALKECGG